MRSPLSAWARTLAALVGAGLLLWLAVPDAGAHPAPIRPAPAPTASPVERLMPHPEVWVGIASQSLCDGVLMVEYDTQSRAGSQWLPLQDDGGWRLQVHELSGRTWPGGSWWDLPDIHERPGETRRPIDTYGHEHLIYWGGLSPAGQRDPDLQGAHFDLVRIVRADKSVISVAQELTGACT